MNIMQIGQQVLSEPVLPRRNERKSTFSTKKPVQIFGVLCRMRHPGNGIIFLVSFLTYLLAIFPSLVYCLPTSGSVQAGSATIDQVSDSQLNIYQSSNKAIIDWHSFSIAGGEHVSFELPSSDSVALNRVTGNDPSSIFGKLTSNGNVMLINRNGILFGNGAEIDVHGLVATSSDISNNDFMQGQNRFRIAPEIFTTVTNQGLITAAEGGLVAFVAPGVQNTGIINARLGKVSLAAGNTFTLDLYGDQLVNLGVDSHVVQQITGIHNEQINSVVSNSGSIYADGGVVAIDVQTVQGLVDNVINMSGHIQARSIAEKNGVIYLRGGGDGLVSVSGSIDATGLKAGETGGVVHVLGDQVGLYDYALIDVSGDAGGGLVLVGGDYQGIGSIPTSVENYVGPNVSVFADAVTGGHGGRTIFWADKRTEFFGTVRTRGGRLFGDGGFVEVSGKEELYFDGSVDTTAVNGKSGTLLLDPDNITVQSGSGTASASGASSFTTYQDTLEAVSSTTNIDLVATESITLNNSLSFAQTSGQSVTFTATTGSITQSSTDTITTSGGSINMTANQNLTIGTLSTRGGDIILTGSGLKLLGSLNAGAGAVTIKGVNGGTIGLDGSTANATASTVSTICNGASCGMTLVQSELSAITTGSITIGDSSSGDLYIDGVTLSHISGGVTLNSTGSDGSVIFGTSDSSLRLATINAGNGITMWGDVVTEQDSTFNADFDANGTGKFSIASGKSLASTGNKNINIVSSGDISIVGAISSGTGQTTISTANGATIGLGGTAGDSTIDTAELGKITAGTLNIGNSSTGNITVDGITAANSNNFTTVNLTTASGSSISFSNNNSTFNALTVNGGGASFGSGLTVATDTGKLTLNSTSITSAGALTLAGATGIDFGSGVTFAAGGTLSMSTTSGDITGAGAFTLTSAGDISLSDNFTTAGATVITADSDGNGSGDFSISTAKTLSTGNSSLTLTANDVTLSGSISAGSGLATVVVSDGGTIGLGGTSGDMTITNTELGKITAGTLNIGNSSTGNITVDGITAANSNNANTVNLTTASGSSISFSNNNSTFNALTVNSGGASFGSGLTVATDTGKLTLNSTSITSAGALTLAGATGIDFGSGVTFAAGGTLSMSTTSGDITGAGAFTLTSAGDISLSDNFTTAGATVITADSDGNGSGDFSISTAKTLSTGNSSLTLTANDVTLSGSISAGSGLATVVVSDGGTIGLGGTSGDMTITNTELGKITAGTLNIGNSSAGNITVDGITAANSNNFTTVNLTTASGSSVSFSNNASTFKNLNVSAGNGISQSVDLTTGGATALDADSNNDGSGDFNNTAGAFSSGGNALSITANDFGLSGTISTGTGTTTIHVSDGGNIGLGSTAGNMTVSGVELGKITAGTLVLGDSTAGAMTVNGVSSANSANISIVDLNASSITFSTGGSTFQGLTSTAHTGAISGTVALSIAGNSTFTASGSNQSITLNDTSNTFIGPVSFNTTGSLADTTLFNNIALTLGTSSIGGDLSVIVGGTNQTLNIAGAQIVDGTINLQSSGDLTLTNSLVTSSTSDSAVLLTSTGGGIFDGDSDGSIDIQAISGRLIVVSNDGFGTTTNPIDTALGSLDLFNSTAGDINIYETDDLEISRLTQNVDNKNITVSYSGNLTGQDQVVFPDGSLGTITFTQREQVVNTKDLILGGTGKSLGVLSVESTVQLAKTVENDVFQMILQNNGSDSKTVANFDSGGSKGPYRTDVFSDSYALVEFSKDTKENYDGSAAMENFWGKPAEEAQIAKLEPLLSPKQESSVSTFQKNDSIAKEVLWKNMVRKVEAKKSNPKNSEEKSQEGVVVAKKANSVQNKTQRPRPSNLEPVSGTRLFEGSGFSAQRKSFR